MLDVLRPERLLGVLPERLYFSSSPSFFYDRAVGHEKNNEQMDVFKLEPPKPLGLMALLVTGPRQKFFSYSSVGLIIVLLIFISLWVATRTYMSAVQMVDHSHTVQKTTATLVMGLTLAETAQRGHLLTGREDYLQPYQLARKQAIDALDKLSVMTKNSLTQRQRMKILVPVVEGKLAEMDNILELQRTRGALAAQAFMIEGSGLVLMERIGGIVNQFDREEQALLQQREWQAEALSVLLLVGLLGYAIIVGGFIWYGLRQLEREQELERANAAYLERELEEQHDLVRQRDMMLQEVNHRVKNSLQQIGGMLRLQMRHLAPDHPARMALMEALNRIMAIGRVHEQMYRTESLESVKAESFLVPLMNEVFSTLLPNSVGKLEIKVDSSIMLPLDKAVPLALLVNELITNSAKYAHKPDKPCHVTVELRKFAVNGCALYLKDNGPGLPQDYSYENSKSLGMRLVQSLTDQLGGKLAMKNTPTGLAYELVVPVL